jgi:hypothetical protein
MPPDARLGKGSQCVRSDLRQALRLGMALAAEIPKSRSAAVKGSSSLSGCDMLVAFDPAYDVARSKVAGCSGIEILPRVFDLDSVTAAPRAIICKMTLDHIAQPIAILRQMAKLASGSSCCRIFVPVPNAGAIFSRGAFCDVYYEHCNYFTSTTYPSLSVQSPL